MATISMSPTTSVRWRTEPATDQPLILLLLVQPLDHELLIK
jgi:hypothetical protein